MIKQKSVRIATASQLAASLLELKGYPLRFDQYEPFRAIYDIDPELMVFKAGRQIGKSVSLGGRLVSKSIALPYFQLAVHCTIPDSGQAFLERLSG